MRYYIDTEFIERGYEHPIELISIGIISDDDREYYAVAADGWDPAHASQWVKDNVIAKLSRRSGSRTLELCRTRAQIASDLRAFVTAGDPPTAPEFFGYYADYDWVLFCQLFGTMLELPTGWPHFCRDVKQFACDLGNPKLPKQISDEHHALADARHIRTLHRFLLNLADLEARGLDGAYH